MKSIALVTFLTSVLLACSDDTDLGGTALPPPSADGGTETPPPVGEDPSTPDPAPDASAVVPAPVPCEPAWTTFTAAQTDEGSSLLWEAMLEHYPEVNGSEDPASFVAAVPDDVWEKQGAFAWTLRVRQDAAYADAARAGGQQWDHTSFIRLVDAVQSATLGKLPEHVRRHLIEPAWTDLAPALIETGAAAVWQASIDNHPNMGDGTDPKAALAGIPSAIWEQEAVYAYTLRVRQDPSYRQQQIDGARSYEHTAQEYLLDALDFAATQSLPAPLLARITASAAWQRCQ